MEHQFEPIQNDLILRTAWGNYAQIHTQALLDDILQVNKSNDRQCG
jgi:hypothetical protein